MTVSTLQQKGTRFCVTINTADDDPDGLYLRDSILAIEEMYKEGRLLYAIGSRERGEEDGRLHLQVWLLAKAQMRVGYLTSQIPQAWACVQSSRDDDKAAAYACNPEKAGFIEKAFEFGERPAKGAGRRTDLDGMNALIASGEIRNIRGVNDANPGVLARHPNWVNYRLEEAVRDEVREAHRASVRPPDLVWMHWLRRYVTELPPDLRKIIFVVGKKGGECKSSFLRTTRIDLGDEAQLLRPGKKADMAQALQSRCRVLGIDVTRGQSDYISHLYPFLEECKDGEVFNPKYMSRMIPLTPCHVLVCMNVDVDWGQGGLYPAFRSEPELEVPGKAPLSYDRYLIWNLEGAMLDPWSPDHRFGSVCPSFEAFDEDFNVVPYVPPLVSNFGSEFSSDMTGDGPYRLAFGNNEDSQETVVGIRADFVPVIVEIVEVIVPLGGDPGEYNLGEQWVVGQRDAGGLDDEAEVRWYDSLESSPQWDPTSAMRLLADGRAFPDSVASGPGGSFIEMTLAHWDDLPERVLTDLLTDADTDTVLGQCVRLAAHRNELSVVDEHFAAGAA